MTVCTQQRMHRLSLTEIGRLGDRRALDSILLRARALLGFLLVVAGLLPLQVAADVEIEVLGGMELLEAGEGEGIGRGSELEASMTSLLLHDFQEVTEGLRIMEAVAMEAMGRMATQQNPVSSTFPDSSAVVGRVFQMKVPNKKEEVYLDGIIKVSQNRTS